MSEKIQIEKKGGSLFVWMPFFSFVYISNEQIRDPCVVVLRI